MAMNDKRRHPRIEEQSRVSVTVIYAPAAAALEGQTFHCLTRDLSVEGLRFCVHSPVPVGTRLWLAVDFDEISEHFQHLGEVKWVQERHEGVLVAKMIGVRLLETEGGPEAAARWKRLLLQKNLLA